MNNRRRKRDLGLLPDGILLHILSFVDAKQAVQSTLISKRWVNLWTSLPSLNFNSNDFENTSSFDDFVDKVLTLRHQLALINSLNFSRKDTTKSQLLERVMSYAVSHDVEHLSIAIQHLEGDDSSCWLSSTSTLLTLNILVPNIIFHYPTKNNACFGKLVTMHIDHARLVQSDAFLGCPNLENLTLIDCEMNDTLKVLVLSGTRLLKLTIASHNDAFRCVEIVLFSSRLTFLKIEGLFPLWVSFQSNDGPPQINEIYLDYICHLFEALSNESKKKLQYYLTIMLRAFQKAKYVTLSTTTIEILAYNFDKLAQEQFPFCNLKSLTFVPSYYQRRKNFKLPLCVMDYFVQSSPQADFNIDFQRRLVD